jgi:phosphatidylglycerol:prolipoprotein diacylglycerol transferase
MHPILFQIGKQPVYSYGFFLALGYLFATFLLWREGKRQGYSEEKLLDLSVASLVAAIIGGRIFYTLLHLGDFQDNPTRVFFFWEGGFAYYGSFVLVLIIASYLIRKWKWSFFQVADFASLAVLVAILFASIGAFLSGNDYGKITSLPWGVTFPFLIGKRHPTQIYSAILSIILFIGLYRLYLRSISRPANLRSGKVFLYFLFFSSLFRIGIDLFRADLSFFLGFPVTSLVSFTIASLSGAALYYYQFRSLRNDLRNLSRYLLGINLRFRSLGRK